LGGQELTAVIQRQCVQLGLDEALQQSTDIAVVNAIARVTGGNFRLVERLFAQIKRVLEINELRTVTTEVVTLARERLVDQPALAAADYVNITPGPRQNSIKITASRAVSAPRTAAPARGTPPPSA
jgi:DNA transposition AAA+ family ATPase